jgi:hypothetical protein
MKVSFKVYLSSNLSIRAKITKTRESTRSNTSVFEGWEKAGTCDTGTSHNILNKNHPGVLTAFKILILSIPPLTCHKLLSHMNHLLSPMDSVFAMISYLT